MPPSYTAASKRKMIWSLHYEISWLETGTNTLHSHDTSSASKTSATMWAR